jgi:hypothetical protein
MPGLIIKLKFRVRYVHNGQALRFSTNAKQFLWNFSWEKFRFGISVLNDQTFIEKQTSVGIDLSYLVQLELSN